MSGNHFLNTPEALLGRNDSKNPSTTCKGITSTGRPCRRALPLSKGAAAGSSSSNIGGVVALFKQDSQIEDAQYYCWQHKEQAGGAIANTNNARLSQRLPEILELKNRSSIDTLVQRLGISDTSDEKQASQEHRDSRYLRTTDSSRPPDDRGHKKHGRPAATQPRAQTFWRSLCCVIAFDDDDTIEIVRHRKRIEQGHMSTTARKPVHTSPESASSLPPRRACATANETINSPLSLVPPNTSPQVASNILAELSKPFSVHDEEGYIYIFWLTPADRQDPGESTAEALLSPEPKHSRTRRISDVLTEFSYDGGVEALSNTGPKAILLKIGRASNVTRRMNQWQRQCGHRLNLVRWYPYTSTSSAPSPLPSPEKSTMKQPLYPDLSQHGRPLAIRRTSSNVRKVPNVKRVERLIHLELAEQQAKQLCNACGREHREWFKIEASEDGARKVDAVVRRWVDWSERAG